MKIEGYAGLQLKRLLTDLASDLSVSSTAVKTLFVAALWNSCNYDELRDAMADELEHISDAEKCGAVVTENEQ